MMPSPRPAFRPSPRAFAAAAAQVTVSPSRTEVRRADPSLSFRVVAPGARGFDVIVTTEPALFDPANAHRRTPKNFRSSRQDFGGEVIEIETGFYLLPRAFLRDLMSLDPKPTRLYYIAVAYNDPAARQGRYSVMPEAMASQAPFVGLAADLAAANLSRMLGVAVDRLGAVNARGRVMAVAASASATPLPDAIGGLPLDRQARRAPDALPGDRAASGFRTAPAGRRGALRAEVRGRAPARARLRACPGEERRRRGAASGGGQWRDNGARGLGGCAGLFRRGLCLRRSRRRPGWLDVPRSRHRPRDLVGALRRRLRRRTAAAAADADPAARSSAGGAERAAGPAGERSRIHARERRRGGGAGRRRRGGGAAGPDHLR